MGIYVKFYHDHSPKITANCKSFYFSPNSVLNFRKSYQIWGKLAQEQKELQAKSKTPNGKHPPPPRAYRVKGLEGHQI